MRLSDSKKSRTLVQEKEKKRPSSAAKVKGKTQKSSVVNKDNEATATKAPIHSTRSEDTVAEECGKRTNTSDQPPPKRKTKVMNVKERKLLVEFLDSGDDTILAEDVKDDLKQQLLADKLKNLVKILCSHEQLLIQLISCHRKCFSQLYLDCKKMSDPMLNFQLCWHNQCSAFLLSQEHNIAVLNLKELSGCNVCHTRDAWLQFCSANGVPVPESNPVMMTITSTIYRVLLESVMNFQESLTATNAVATASEYKDGDDVYYRFGGATICEMLKLHYKQIRSCSDEQRDHLSQEIVILQAMKTDDKSIIPDYLKYRDRGYMYFPHGTFIPFLKAVDDTVKRVVNPDGLEENGSELIKVCVACHLLYIVTFFSRLPIKCLKHAQISTKCLKLHWSSDYQISVLFLKRQYIVFLMLWSENFVTQEYKNLFHQQSNNLQQRRDWHLLLMLIYVQHY